MTAANNTPERNKRPAPDAVDSEPEEVVEEEEGQYSSDSEPDQSTEGAGAGPDGELDESVYTLFHRIAFDWPCLSVDALFDPLQTEAPYVISGVAGSQTDRAKENKLYVFKCRTYPIENKENISDSDSSSESDEDTEEADSAHKKPRNTMNCIGLKHFGGCNRVRATRISDTRQLVATWSEKGQVSVYNVYETLKSIDPAQSKYERDSTNKPLFTYSGHKCEGFGLAWSPVASGHLASGDCRGSLCLWTPNETAFTVTSKFDPVSASIEDIQWSPAEATVLAGCCTDGALRVWDSRSASSTGRAMLTAEHIHASDANVISWNHKEPFIVSGGDDKLIKVWDLRQLSKLASSTRPVAQYDFHRGPITSVQWNPSESTQFAAASEDHTLSIWDLSLEKDTSALVDSTGTEGEANDKDNDSDQATEDIPAQLLFLHEGQRDVKEVAWHPALHNLLLSTAATGLHILLPANL